MNRNKTFLIRIIRSAVAVICLSALTFTTPAIAYAIESASNFNELMEIVSKHVVERDSKFSVSYTGDAEEIKHKDDHYQLLVDLELTDDPNTTDDADYVAGNIDLNVLFRRGIYYIPYNNTFNYTMKYYETLPQTQYVNENVPKILKKIGVDGMSTYEKIDAVHKYVCKLITYPDHPEKYDYASIATMYDALDTGYAICNSYALCMYKLLVSAGVPCKYIGGEIKDGKDSGGHAWNIVAVGDRWYNLDATWDDDEEKGISKAFFLRGSSDFDSLSTSGKHVMDIQYRTGAFAKAFPIAKNAFLPALMDDENKIIKIGDSSGSTAGDQEEMTYKSSDIVYTKSPSSGKFSVKKGKNKHLLLGMHEGSDSLVKKVTYKFTTGKSRVKSVKNYGVVEDEGLFYTHLSFKGKKKGKVNVTVTLKLKNGQSLNYKFKGKVK
ncbi:MAG: transglutaminase-like domain-containing protein [Eubacterium sp.]|nr:transglutaminase-like domain-containing protein [Eubacterium sp.]